VRRCAIAVTDQQRAAVRDRCDGAALDDFELRDEQARAALLDVIERKPADGARAGTDTGACRTGVQQQREN
jgi:hypothetical protein